MRLTELAVNAADLDYISQEQLGVRSVGLHVSQIIRHIMETSGLAEQSDFTDDDLNMFAVIGRLWEQMLADTVFRPPRYQRPGEIELDGIYGSPDAVDTEDGVLAEYKVCWKSSNRSIESFFKYWLQIKSYCWMLGLNKARLYVFFVNGTYKPPLPIIKAWEAEFTTPELRDNWRVIKENAVEMKP